jgi:predicted aspartyl protease
MERWASPLGGRHAADSQPEKALVSRNAQLKLAPTGAESMTWAVRTGGFVASTSQATQRVRKMRLKSLRSWIALATLPVVTGVQAVEFDHTVPMHRKHLATFYVQGAISGFGDVELMVDTGAGYMTINQGILSTLQAAGQVEYVKDLTGVLADGSRIGISVYRINEIRVGEGCVLRDVEAALFPDEARMLLGLSALQKAAPFVFSTDPPRLLLSNCTTSS